MKIKVVKNGTTNVKPSNYCPWAVDVPDGDGDGGGKR